MKIIRTTCVRDYFTTFIVKFELYNIGTSHKYTVNKFGKKEPIRFNNKFTEVKRLELNQFSDG